MVYFEPRESVVRAVACFTGVSRVLLRGTDRKASSVTLASTATHGAIFSICGSTSVALLPSSYIPAPMNRATPIQPSLPQRLISRLEAWVVNASVGASAAPRARPRGGTMQPRRIDLSHQPHLSMLLAVVSVHLRRGGLLRHVQRRQWRRSQFRSSLPVPSTFNPPSSCRGPSRP